MIRDVASRTYNGKTQIDKGANAVLTQAALLGCGAITVEGLLDMTGAACEIVNMLQGSRETRLSNAASVVFTDTWQQALLLEKNADGAETHYEYNDDGACIRVTDALGYTHDYCTHRWHSSVSMSGFAAKVLAQR